MCNKYSRFKLDSIDCAHSICNCLFHCPIKKFICKCLYQLALIIGTTAI